MAAVPPTVPIVRDPHGGGSGRNGSAPRNSDGPLPGTSRPPRLLARTSYVTDRVEDMIQSALAWRNLVQMLWIEMGRPPVPGFPASRVQQILWGELPPENGFFAALLTALTSRSRAGSAGAESWWHRNLQRVLDSYDTSPDTRHITALPASRPESDHGADFLMLDPEGNTMMAIQVKHGGRGRGNGVEAASASRCEATLKLWDLAELAAGDWPDPGAVETEAEFIAALRKLKDTTKLSLRQIEQRSKTTTAGWLPRATAADMLRRETLPKPDTLWSLTAALGLTKQDQDKWEAARSRLHQQRRTQRRLQSVPADATDADLDEYNSPGGNDIDAQTA